MQNSDRRILAVIVGIFLLCICGACLTVVGVGVMTIEPLRTITLSSPQTAADYNQRGLAFHNLGQEDEAISNYARAIELDPNYAEAFFNRGNAYTRLEQYEPGIADYKKAIELNIQQPLAYGYLCWYGSLAGHAAEILDACEKGVQLDPNNGGIRDSRGLARALTGDYRGAIEDFKAYVTWSKQNGKYEQRGYKREIWIRELEVGRNPFDPATLKELRTE